MRRRSLATRAGGGHYATGADRWLVSYADYMTLAFALFVVLYALHANKTELQQPLLDGMEQAFVRLSGETKPAHAANSMISNTDELEAQGTGNPLTAEDISLASVKAQLELRLGPLLEKNMLALEQEGDWLTLSFDGRLVFASGSALLSGNADIILNAALPVLAEVSHFIRVRGYADNLPVSNELYASNWQLSAERARAVLEWLQRHGIAAPRLSLEAFGEFRPQQSQLLDEALTNSNRANNRRVEIAISKQTWLAPTALPSRPLGTEPSAEQGSGQGSGQKSELRVYELPNGGIRIGTSATQDGITQ
ncbi:OmpA family protein [Oceanisphaera sp. IT1-181]|uniref:OmpA family protein n=1 Tax=Oceanisphaera sp. IT1-181 TaxID=3081199 RepID=UPI0029CA0B33|nr:OmpA family protein [Oceanisphaera sp. IT1-181]